MDTFDYICNQHMQLKVRVSVLSSAGALSGLVALKLFWYLSC